MHPASFTNLDSILFPNYLDSELQAESFRYFRIDTRSVNLRNSQGFHLVYGVSPRGAVANVLDCDVIVSEFELQFTSELILLRDLWTT